MIPLRPPYTATDLSLAIVAILAAILNVFDMFGWMPIPADTRAQALNALATILAVALSALAVNRGLKHVGLGLRAQAQGTALPERTLREG